MLSWLPLGVTSVFVPSAAGVIDWAWVGAIPAKIWVIALITKNNNKLLVF
ncbi:hypothetical protein NIES4074_28710 [Cylindrospermum sp. NIES-4074]|nr:hypothetical protein NIES4074_28710 [Cylindrospermum sp. NIES-4074]